MLLSMRLIDLEEPQGGNRDNITDWCLEQFQNQYGSYVSKDDIWEYMYGVMHAPDWRERYRFDLQRSLPRVPFADDFDAFRSAGRDLMDLHIGYETCEEYPIWAVAFTERERERERAILVTSTNNRAVFGTLVTHNIPDGWATGTNQASRAIPRRTRS